MENVEFNDLYSIDKESLEQLAPVYGVIFLFKYSSIDREYAENGNKPLHGDYDTDYQSKGIFFANQTIQNACATQAVLNMLMNKPEINIGSELDNFKEFVTGFDGSMAGETIGNSELIRNVHNSFSAPLGIEIDDDRQSAKQDYSSDGVFHFVGYLQMQGHIYELDGLKTYPIKHIACEPDEFCAKLPGVIQERISKYPLSELRFSLLVMSENRLEKYLREGNEMQVAREMEKREGWRRENELRKHDHTSLLIGLLSNISKRCNDDEWAKMMVNATRN